MRSDKLPPDFFRTVEDSLTTQAHSRVFTLTQGQLELALSPPRLKYRNYFDAWHMQGVRNCG
jgi:hypothetical protein